MIYILDSDVSKMAVELIPKLWIANKDGVIYWVNHPTSRLFGYDYGELLHKQVEILVPQEFKEIHPLHRAKVTSDSKGELMAGGRPLRGVRKDGTEIQVQIWLVRCSLSGVDGVLAVIFDMSSRILSR